MAASFRRGPRPRVRDGQEQCRAHSATRPRQRGNHPPAPAGPAPPPASRTRHGHCRAQPRSAASTAPRAWHDRRRCRTSFCAAVHGRRAVASRQGGDHDEVNVVRVIGLRIEKACPSLAQDRLVGGRRAHIRIEALAPAAEPVPDVARHVHQVPCARASVLPDAPHEVPPSPGAPMPPRHGCRDGSHRDDRAWRCNGPNWRVPSTPSSKATIFSVFPFGVFPPSAQ